MGIFYDMVEVRNLAPINLTVTFDGQEKTLPPGISVVPKQVVPFAMNQNPVMGKQDPNNPHISGGEYLVVPVGTKYDREPLTTEEWADHLGRPCRVDEVAIFDEKYAGDPKAKMLARGKKGKPAAKSLYEAGKNPQGLASFENRE